MDKNYWVKKWQSNDIAFHRQDINSNLIEHIKKLNLQFNNHILVPLCGKSKDMVWLAENGYYVVGIEISPIACEEFFSELNVNPEIIKTKHFTKYKHNNIEILCGDFFDLTSKDLPNIDAVYDCKALIALPPEMRKKYVRQLINCTDANAHILLIALESSCKVEGPPFPVDNVEINSLYESHFNVQRVKYKAIADIANNLIQKGYSQLTETVYTILSKKRY